MSIWSPTFHLVHSWVRYPCLHCYSHLHTLSHCFTTLHIARGADIGRCRHTVRVRKSALTRTSRLALGTDDLLLGLLGLAPRRPPPPTGDPGEKTLARLPAKVRTYEELDFYFDYSADYSADEHMRRKDGPFPVADFHLIVPSRRRFLSGEDGEEEGEFTIPWGLRHSCRRNSRTNSHQRRRRPATKNSNKRHKPPSNRALSNSAHPTAAGPPTCAGGSR